MARGWSVSTDSPLFWAIKVAILLILGNCKTRCTRDTSTVSMLSVPIFSTHVLVLESPVGSWVWPLCAAVCGGSRLPRNREATSERNGDFGEERLPNCNERRL